MLNLCLTNTSNPDSFKLCSKVQNDCFTTAFSTSLKNKNKKNMKGLKRKFEPRRQTKSTKIMSIVIVKGTFNDSD